MSTNYYRQALALMATRLRQDGFSQAADTVGRAADELDTDAPTK